MSSLVSYLADDGDINVEGAINFWGINLKTTVLEKKAVIVFLIA